MRINQLQLENYRNYLKLQLAFAATGALICGENGSGKTNLLEAIAYFAFGRSMLLLQDRDLVRFGEDYFRISADFTYLNKALKIEAAYTNEQKKISINEHKIKRISELFKYLKVVYFSPKDIEFTSGNPGFRRFFFDLAISQNSFSYMENLKEYNRILKQRNALLKTNFDKREKLSWDKNFVKTGCEIIRQRNDYMQQFLPYLIEFNEIISDNKDKLTYNYQYSFPLIEDNLEKSYQAYLKNNEAKEIHYQRSLCGPHLDDFYFKLNERSFKKFGSQGQKRSLAISARLVQAKLIADATGDFPILMFDDVLADLDSDRAGRILQLLRDDHQIFIATPNSSHYNLPDFEKIDLAKR